MSTETTYAEVAEGVRAAIAAYAQALDDGRTDDLVAAFCPDGVSEIPGTGTYEGHDALRAAFSSWTPHVPQRHLVANTVVAEWNDHEATATSDLVLLVLGDSGWAIRLVGRYDDVLHHDDGVWRFHHRLTTFVTKQSSQKGTA